MPAYFIVIAISVGVAALLALIPLFLRKKVYARIETFSWERSIATEHQVWVKEVSYKNFPEKSRNRKTKQESYRKSTTVYRDKYVYRPDNPGPEDYVWVSEPVTEWTWETRTRYEYEVPKWERGRTLVTSGRSREGVRWPDEIMTEGIQRSREKKERYTVRFVADNRKRYATDLAERVWTELDANADYLLIITLFRKVVQWQPLQRKRSTAPQQAQRSTPQPQKTQYRPGKTQ